MRETYKLHWSILKEYDIRGIYGKTLTSKDAYAIGRAFGTIITNKKQNTVCVGYDGRHSSPVLETALVNGLVDSGITVNRIGLGPTPMLYFASQILNADGAIMVTGSHNPKDHNGFKFVLNNKPFFGEDIQKLGALVAKGNFNTGKGFSIYCTVMEEYVDRLVSDYHGKRKLKVAWDAGNGATGPFIQGITRRMPGTHFVLNAKVDGDFPNHHPDPTVPENLVQLRETVLREKCDVGVAFDGDGDRLGVIDGKGHILWGDQLTMIYSREILKNNPGSVIIADVKSSDHLFKDIEENGGNSIMWRTGHSHIKEKMITTGALLAGEMSGHIFFNDHYYGYDDGIYAAIRLLDILSNSEESMSKIREKMPICFNTPELRFPCEEEKKFKIVNEIKKRLLKGKNNSSINTIDGIRVKDDKGWWLLRASNTQNVLVARCESTTAEGLDVLKSTIMNHLQLSGINCAYQ